MSQTSDTNQDETIGQAEKAEGNTSQAFNEYLAQIKERYPTFQYQVYDLLSEGDVTTLSNVLHAVVYKPAAKDAFMLPLEGATEEESREILEKQKRRNELERKASEYCGKLQDEASNNYWALLKGNPRAQTAIESRIDERTQQIDKLYEALAKKAAQARNEQDEQQYLIIEALLKDVASKLEQAMRILLHTETLIKNARRP